MESNHLLSRDVLHEDLQILRYTLAAILDDVRRLSPISANAVERAIQDLDRARYELGDEDGNRSATDKISRPSPARGLRAKRHATEIFSPTSSRA